MATYKFEDYIEKANQASDTDDLKEIFMATLAELGIDCFNLVFSTPHPHLKLDADLNIIKSDWRDYFSYYRDMKFEKIDPVLAYSVLNNHPFSWDFLFKNVAMSKKQANVIHSFQEAGFYHGIYFPMSRGNFHAGIGLASTCSENNIGLDRKHDLLSAYCHHFYDAFSRLKAVDSQFIIDFCTLTDKEKEILTLAAFGKTDSEIAQILGISPNTVETHLRHCYVKLDATNRTSAVAIGLARQYISLNRM